MGGHSIIVEEGGRMVIMLADWSNLQDCLTYHASREYRQVVACTQHLLGGDFFVKLFHNRTS
jgi:hypothetical protein